MLVPLTLVPSHPHPDPTLTPTPLSPGPHQGMVAPLKSRSRVKFVWPNVMRSAGAMREFGTMCTLALLFGLLVFFAPSAAWRATGLTGMVAVGLWYIQWIHSVLRFTKS